MTDKDLIALNSVTARAAELLPMFRGAFFRLLVQKIDKAGLLADLVDALNRFQAERERVQQ
jgi:hypothetical protein